MYQRLHQGPFPCRGDQIQAGGGSGREPRRPTAWTATDTSGARVPLLAPAEARTRRWPGHLPHALNQWGRIARRISLRGGGLFARRELLIPCVPPPPPPRGPDSTGWGVAYLLIDTILCFVDFSCRHGTRSSGGTGTGGSDRRLPQPLALNRGCATLDSSGLYQGLYQGPFLGHSNQVQVD